MLRSSLQASAARRILRSHAPERGIEGSRVIGRARIPIRPQVQRHENTALLLTKSDRLGHYDATRLIPAAENGSTHLRDGICIGTDGHYASARATPRHT